MREPKRTQVLARLLSTRWPYFRATLITLALCSQCVSALPDKALTRDKLDLPESRRALRWLGVALRPFGVRAPQDVESTVLTQSQRLVAARHFLLRPVAPLIDAAGMRQQWHLFLTARADVYRLRVDAAMQDGTWTTLYRADHEDALQLAPALEYRRMRGIYNPGREGPRHQYAGFVHWLMARVWKDHPEYAALRVGMEHVQLAGPERDSDVLGTEFAIEEARPVQP